MYQSQSFAPTQNKVQRFFFCFFLFFFFFIICLFQKIHILQKQFSKFQTFTLQFTPCILNKAYNFKFSVNISKLDSWLLVYSFVLKYSFIPYYYLTQYDSSKFLINRRFSSFIFFLSTAHLTFTNDNIHNART